MIAKACTSFTQCHNFGVGGGIRLEQVSVPTSSHNKAIADDDSSNRYLACLVGPPSGTESLLHPEFVGTRQLSSVNPELSVLGCLLLVLGHLRTTP